MAKSTTAQKRIEITVIKRADGELLFQTEGVFFDILWALDEFAGGELKIYRKNKIIDQTSCIIEVGSHASHMVFYGLTDLFKGRYRGGASTPDLDATNFQDGDKLVLKVSVSPDWDLAGHIRTFGLTNEALLSAFNEKKTWKMGALVRRAEAELTKSAPNLKPDQVVRFRQ